ncbi:MAG: alpha/beta hydrolase [Pseudomonadota bacterium]
MVLVHGGGPGTDSEDNWSACIPGFAQHFTVYAPDFVGFGRSDKPDPDRYEYNQSARTGQIAGFIEALGLGAIALVGNALGGAVAVGTTIERPDLVSKLVINGALGVAPSTGEKGSARQYLPSREVSRENIAAFVRMCTDEKRDIAAEVEYRYQLMQQAGAVSAYDAVQAWLSTHGGVVYEDSAIAGITQPTLIVWAKHNRVTSFDLALRFMDLIANSRLYVIPNSGHWTMVMRPDEFVGITTEFLLHTS